MADVNMQDDTQKREMRQMVLPATTNNFVSRRQRRLIAKRNGLFKHGQWPKLTVTPEQNVQTIKKGSK